MDEFDRAAALERCGDDAELLRELVDMFLTAIPGWMQELEAAVRSGNADEVKRIAHTVKGAVGTFAASPAWEAALQMEIIGKEGRLGEAGPAWEQMKAVIGRLTAALSAFQG